MQRAIKPVGGPPAFIWSGLLDPNYVKRKDVPKMAGIYVVVAHDTNGKPITQQGEPAHSPLPGVVYVGMTGSRNTLKGRFMALARAWRKNSKQRNPSHGSRKHYNKDSIAQKLFLVGDVRLRYMPLPSDVQSDPLELTQYAQSINRDVKELRTLFGLEKTADKRVEAVEKTHIQWFKRQYDYIPILNRDDDGAHDVVANDLWLKSQIAEMERKGL